MAPSEMHRQRRGRNYALGGFLLVLVVIFFIVTLVKMKGMA